MKLQGDSVTDAALARYNGPAHWAFDGVRPNSAGHELIARAWLRGFEQIK